MKPITQQQLANTFKATLLLVFAIALTLAVLTIQVAAQIANTLDNLVSSSLRPTPALPQAIIPFGLLNTHTVADDILADWTAKAQAIAPIPTSEYINFPECSPPTELDLTDFTLRDLKDLAKLRGIVGYSKMSKAALRKALG